MGTPGRDRPANRVVMAAPPRRATRPGTAGLGRRATRAGTAGLGRRATRAAGAGGRLTRVRAPAATDRSPAADGTSPRMTRDADVNVPTTWGAVTGAVAVTAAKDRLGTTAGDAACSAGVAAAPARMPA